MNSAEGQASTPVNPTEPELSALWGLAQDADGTPTAPAELSNTEAVGTLAAAAKKGNPVYVGSQEVTTRIHEALAHTVSVPDQHHTSRAVHDFGVGESGMPMHLEYGPTEYDNPQRVADRILQHLGVTNPAELRSRVGVDANEQTDLAEAA